MAVAGEVLVGLDFDGTLSPIVEDPSRAVIHPDGPRVLRDLAACVRAVVVITGRPARQVVELGGLEAVADSLAAGSRLVVLGQYGNERWDSGTREFTAPEPPPGLQAFRDELPALLAAQDADGAFVEEKGLAVAVHTRRLPDAAAAYDRLQAALAERRRAARAGPRARPDGAGGPCPGHAQGPRGARRPRGAPRRRGAVRRGRPRRPRGVRGGARAARPGPADPAGLLGLRGAEALAELSDVVVDGPAGVLGLLARFAADVRSAQAD